MDHADIARRRLCALISEERGSMGAEFTALREITFYRIHPSYRLCKMPMREQVPQMGERW